VPQLADSPARCAVRPVSQYFVRVTHCGHKHKRGYLFTGVSRTVSLKLINYAFLNAPLAGKK